MKASSSDTPRGLLRAPSGPRRGYFVEADRGTLFLDEVGELPPSLQVKLLRALQEEEIRPLGETKARQVDVRVLAATARELEREVREGHFREDLFYRLNVVRVEVPPLRERQEDIPLLVDHFVRQLGQSLGKPLRGVTDEALEKLVGYPWPGNVRELENVVERALILSRGERLRLDDLPRGVIASRGEQAPAAPGPAEQLSLRRARRRAEIEVIRRALDATGGNRTQAAQLLRISHRALLYKIKDYGLRGELDAGGGGDPRPRPAAPPAGAPFEPPHSRRPRQ